MDVAFITKIIGDLCLWFSASGFILSLFGPVGSAFACAAVLVAGSALSVLIGTKKPALRFLPLLAFGFCVFWIRGLLDGLLIIPPGLYCVWICLYRPFAPQYAESRKYVTGVAPAALVIILLIAIFGGSDILRTHVQPYYIVFLFSAVLTLRISRYEDTKRNDWRLWLLICLSLAACSAAALIFSSEWFFRAAGAVLSLIYQYVLAPLLSGLAYVFAGIMWLILKLFRIDDLKAQQSGSEMPDLTDNLKVDFGDVGVITADSDLFRKIAIALAIVAFITLAVIFFRRLAVSDSSSVKPETGIRDLRKRITDKKEDELPPAKLPGRNARQAVRRTYRKFLVKAHSAGLDIRPSDTSFSIAQSAEAFFDAELLGKLREVYIAARYSPREITKSDVKLAKSICAELKPK